jgi:hypothetical protein
MEKALIVSLNFNPGHLSHLIASYKQCKEIGYEPYLYINEKFKYYIHDTTIQYYTYGNLPDKFHKNDFLIIFWFPSTRNIIELLKFKIKSKSQFCYVFHEPFDSLANYYKSGFSIPKILRIIVINLISLLTVSLSTLILLPSQKAHSLYLKNKLKIFNKNAYLFPLIFDDELKTSKLEIAKKIYFSYIGTIAEDHAFEEFLKFISHCIINNQLPQFNFLIATKSSLENYKSYTEVLQNSGRVKLVSGKPLSNEEINQYYYQSAIIWNAYHRSTQSGVLPKALMFGTPVIVLEKNKNEFTIDHYNCILMRENKYSNEIIYAAENIQINQKMYLENCRQSFMKNFYYRNKNVDFKKILSHNGMVI